MTTRKNTLVYELRKMALKDMRKKVRTLVEEDRGNVLDILDLHEIYKKMGAVWIEETKMLEKFPKPENIPIAREKTRNILDNNINSIRYL